MPRADKVEPLRLTCASSDELPVPSLSSSLPLLQPPVSWPHPLLPAAPSDALTSIFAAVSQRSLLARCILFA